MVPAANVRFPPFMSLVTIGPNQTLVILAAKVGFEPLLPIFCYEANGRFN